MTQPESIGGLWSEIGNQLQLLAISGVAGALFRAVISPEEKWRRRIVQAVVGAVAAIFLGGAVAQVINAVVDTGVYAYLAGGFIMGSGGEAAVRAMQNRFIGK